MRYTRDDHTFVICAYQENPYLEECIRSVMSQKTLGKVKVSTSTPNGHILGLAKKYGLPVAVNHGIGNATDNLNFGYSQAETKLVTLCHQDDYYCPDYLEKTLEYANSCKKLVILFTDYFEDRDGVQVSTNTLLKVKRILNLPLRVPGLRESRWVKRRVLSFGNSICCPSVMFNKEAIPGVPFTTDYSNCLDWGAWVEMAALQGSFVYCPHKLMGHRIWLGSGTSEYIANGDRAWEESQILHSLWPDFIAEFIIKMFSKAMDSNG